MRFQSCLRLLTHTFKTKHEYKFDLLSMSSNKRIGDGLHNISSSPTKLRRVKTENRSSVQQSSTFTADILNKNGMGSVEVMETPDKSEYDKKSYRVILLENGVKCLLISDPTQEYVPHDDEGNHRASVTNDGDDNKDEEEEADDENSEGDESDDESGGHDGDEKRSKLAACSLCVDVGSFSDPRDVQGLAHFLGKFVQFFIKSIFFKPNVFKLTNIIFFQK